MKSTNTSAKRSNVQAKKSSKFTFGKTIKIHQKSHSETKNDQEPNKRLTSTKFRQLSEIPTEYGVKQYREDLKENQKRQKILEKMKESFRKKPLLALADKESELFMNLKAYIWSKDKVLQRGSVKDDMFESAQEIKKEMLKNEFAEVFGVSKNINKEKFRNNSYTRQKYWRAPKQVKLLMIKKSLVNE